MSCRNKITELTCSTVCLLSTHSPPIVSNVNKISAKILAIEAAAAAAIAIVVDIIIIIIVFRQIMMVDIGIGLESMALWPVYRINEK